LEESFERKLNNGHHTKMNNWCFVLSDSLLARWVNSGYNWSTLYIM